MRKTPAFNHGVLDRLSGHRSETGRMEALLEAQSTRIAVFLEDKLVMHAGGPGSGGVAWHSRGALPDLHEGIEPVLLGVDGENIAHFAVLAADPEVPLDDGHAAIDLRSIALQGLLEDPVLGTAAQARALLHWHTRHRFCSNCGSPTQPADAGYRRDCHACETLHFPRTDPAVIIAITRGDKMLLGRSGRFSETMYSTLAGFVEPGETIEDAARREVKEETNIDVGQIRYLMSQPWPFPANLMIGLVGEATSEDINVDQDELVDARWFSLDDVRAMDEGRHSEGLEIPPAISIAHFLIKAVLEEQN